MKRRRFLKAALSTVVGMCLPLPAIPRAKPPLSPVFTPGIWAGSGGIDIDEWLITEETLLLWKKAELDES